MSFYAGQKMHTATFYLLVLMLIFTYFNIKEDKLNVDVAHQRRRQMM
jgi:hypothetical protein